MNREKKDLHEKQPDDSIFHILLPLLGVRLTGSRIWVRETSSLNILLLGWKKM